MAVLWDIRILPEMRGRGIGKALFQHVIAWARARDCREIKIETQNNNVSACRFYQRQGCRLSEINRQAYADFPDEIELIWSLEL